MALDPAARPGGAGVARRLSTDDPAVLHPRIAPSEHFVGRRLEHDALAEVLAMTQKEARRDRRRARR